MMTEEQNSNPLTAIQATLERMERRLDSVFTDVENLKRNKSAYSPAAQPSGGGVTPGVVQSTAAHSAVLTPENGDDEDDTVVPTLKLSWGERMELEDEQDTTSDRPGGEKLRLTQVHRDTETFLREAFNPVSNAERRQLRQQFIVPDTPFTTAPRLDKVMAAECSKSVKSADNLLSRIQALFLDAVGPLSQLLDGAHSGSQLTIDDMEDAVKAALTFLGNASSQCISLRRVGILEEYNKDLVSFSQESTDLFASATNTLFGPSFPEKASEHLKQLQTLRQARGKANQPFSRAPSHMGAQRGGKSYSLQRRGSQPYSKGGHYSSRGRGAPPSSQRTKSK